VSLSEDHHTHEPFRYDNVIIKYECGCVTFVIIHYWKLKYIKGKCHNKKKKIHEYILINKWCSIFNTEMIGMQILKNIKNTTIRNPHNHWQYIMMWITMETNKIMHLFSSNFHFVTVLIIVCTCNKWQANQRFQNISSGHSKQNVSLVSLDLFDMGRQVRKLFFFLLKCAKIWNKIPHRYGTWKNKNILKKITFIFEEKINWEHLFLW